MKIVSTVEQVREEVKKWRQQGLTVGLVPTMGYLHEGHKSLIDKAVAQNDKVVVSVFVNPIQFGPTEDLATYPRDLERDAALCEDAGAALIFHPEKEDMYFDDFCTYIDMDGLTKGLCGKTRPIHFRGVCTVVGKLFNIVHPDRAYFGQKDAQQLAVVRRMVREEVKKWRQQGLTVGLVPTMGYLHEGHKSLIDKAVAQNDKVVVSVFVNPIQFGPTEDLATYPRDLERDAALCEDAGAALIFHPEKEDMYFDDFCTYIDMDGLTKGLCGKTRPIHFRGVCTVVGKLFNIVHPDRAYFGQKDAQQLAVVRRMVRDLNFDLEIVGCPIIREEDGLAKSSRNTYLSEEERKAAVILHKGLVKGEEMVSAGEKDVKKVLDAITEIIESEPLARIDYVEAVDFDNIETIDTIEGSVLVAVAVYIGKTRLIDNFIVGL